MASTLSPDLTHSRSSANIKSDSARFQLSTNTFVRKLGFKFLTKPRLQTRPKSKSRGGNLADSANNHPYIQSGPGSRATRSMDILRKPQPFSSMLAVDKAAFLNVDDGTDPLRRSMDGSTSREWKASLSNDVSSKGSVAQGLAVAALVASAEAGAGIVPVQRASFSNDRFAGARDETQPSRPGVSRSDHSLNHSHTSGLPTSTTSANDDSRSTSARIFPSTAGLQSGLGQEVGQEVLEADGPEANIGSKNTNQSESHKQHSTRLAPTSLVESSQQHRPQRSSSFLSSSSAPPTSSPATKPSPERAADSHKGLLAAAGLGNTNMETATMSASSSSAISVSTTTKYTAAQQPRLSTHARAPAPRLNTLPSLPPLTTTFAPSKRVTESPTTASPSSPVLSAPEITPTSPNAMQQARKQKAAALALSGGVRLSPSVIVRAPPFPILPLPPTSPSVETRRAGLSTRSFRSASMSDGIPSSSSSAGRDGSIAGPSSEGRSSGRRTASRLNSMPHLPMEGQLKEDDAEDDADHMLEDEMIGEEDEDAEGDPRMSIDSADVGSASDDEDGSAEDETAPRVSASSSSSMNPFRTPSGRPFLPKSKRDLSFSAFLGLDVKGKDKEALLPSFGPGPGGPSSEQGMVTPKASVMLTKREREKGGGEKERGDYFNFALSVSPPSIASSSSSGSAGPPGPAKGKGTECGQSREGDFEREMDSALKTPTAADYRSSGATTPRWPSAADYSGTAMWRDITTALAAPGGGVVGETSMTNGTVKRPGLYHQVSKSMVDLVRLSRPSEDAPNANANAFSSSTSNAASPTSAGPASGDVRNSRVQMSAERGASADGGDERSREDDGNKKDPGNVLSDPAREASRTLPGSGTQGSNGATISATSASLINTRTNEGPIAQRHDAKESSQGSGFLGAAAQPPSSSSTATTSSGTVVASGAPTLRRQRSMPTFTASGPPPPYPSFLLTSSTNGQSQQYPHLQRFSLPQPREEEGREALPPYSNTIKLSAIMPRKLEFAAPGVPARDRKWRRVHVVLEGTAFRVYHVPHAVAGVSAVASWWENKVGVGDVAQGNGISASSDARGIVIGNTGRREPRRKSKWEEEMDLRAQEVAEAQAEAQQGRASITIERASMESQGSSSGLHQPQQQHKSKLQLSNLLHPNRSRISVSNSTRSQPVSPAVSPPTTPRSSLQITRPSTDTSISASNSLSPSASLISHSNSRSNSMYGNISSSSSTFLSSTSNSTMSSSAQIAPSASQSSHARSHFRLHHRRNESAPLNSITKDNSNVNVREKEKDTQSLPDPNPKDLIRVYTLQHAESGLASDYFKRKNVLRVRMEGEQFLLQARDIPEVVEWIEGLQAASNIALDLDERPMPKGPIYPRRRRRRRARTEASTNQSTAQPSAS